MGVKTQPNRILPCRGDRLVALPCISNTPYNPAAARAPAIRPNTDPAINPAPPG